MNFEKWKVTREKGKKRFLWVNGALQWGITTALLWSLVMQVTNPVEPIWFRPAIALALFPLGGLFWAHFVWQSSESKYKDHEQKVNP
ncbi:hypothetical protein [uncultured Microbulbifer sp.]|uniref:hypothetical protein n=1 Tax=uncultured Microbulbifer sp. TaxID=348147 RepID=UPI002610F6D8|nr:hypothetical protein [uncultured Microbulbifer sp.]